MNSNVEPTHEAGTASRRRSAPPLIKAFNVVSRALLRSPLHGVMSNKLLLLTFTGRKTGRAYTTPVSYFVADDGSLIIAGGAPWWKNLHDGEPVRVRLRGWERSARPDVVRDSDELAKLLQVILPRNPILGRFMGLKLDAEGRLNPSQLERARGRGLALIRLRLGDL